MYSNLDIKGVDPAKVEDEYLKVLGADDQNLNSLWNVLQFYLTIGDVRKSLQYLEKVIKRPSISVEICTNIIWPYTQYLLQCLPAGHKLAREILKHVPEELKNIQHRGCERLCYMYEQASMNKAVVPPEYLDNNWWERGPFLLKKENLKEWEANHIPKSTIISDNEIKYIQAVIERGEPEPVFYTVNEPLESLEKLIGCKLTEMPSPYFEVGTYDDMSEVVRIHTTSDISWEKFEESLGLPLLNLDPDRYKKKPSDEVLNEQGQSAG